MSGKSLLEQMSQSPLGWRIEDIETVCRIYGLRCIPPRGGGSHYKVSCAWNAKILTIPYKKPIKPVYIQKLVRLIDSKDQDPQND